MKKYSPSIKNNNALKDKALKDLKKVCFKLETHKVNSYLDKDAVDALAVELKDAISGLDNCVGTGKEDISSIAETVSKQVVELNELANQDLVTRLEEGVSNLTYSVDVWKSVLQGDMNSEEIGTTEKEKMTWSRKKLQNRLDELATIKNQFVANEQRLEKDIYSLEKDLNELDSLMLKEENERRINELYRKISSLKSKLDMLNVRKANYSACFNLLDLIYSNANEIVVESDYSLEDLGKARALLNMSRLKSVISEPEKAISILKRMEKDTQLIAERTKNMDEKVFGVNTSTISVSQDALAYKEQLLRKKKEKEELKSNQKEMDSGIDASEELEVGGTK
ncbi:MAG: hypothetical protein SPK28_04990 [Bacilli bacterium]|nr:hypothetical protein [Bacilli bacterium]